MKKKLLALLMTVAVAAGMLTGCGSTQETQTPVSEENKLTGETVAQETPVLEGKLTVWCWDPAFNINAVNTAADIYKKIIPILNWRLWKSLSRIFIRNWQPLQQRATQTKCCRISSCLMMRWLHRQHLPSREYYWI